MKVLLVMLLSGGCGAVVPDPRAAASAYADAAIRGDTDRLIAMMTSSSKRARSKDATERLLKDERGELAEQGRELSRADVRVEATALLRYADGEEAALELREGRYWVTAAGALPGGARTPQDALDQLRRAIARRSYSALLRLLSPGTLTAIETDLRSLVEGLSDPAALPVQPNGDSASVVVPGGHRVNLRRDAGVWRVEDFD